MLDYVLRILYKSVIVKVFPLIGPAFFLYSSHIDAFFRESVLSA